ncbi:unnamed protein product [Candidula unifasciata]|uniref:Pyrroline-5-carboxylate reductase catalytic N-terminal domain-containing protein n=1 Tax=Candidula unifasciata TaxID=100452 RepID=A0A8S4A398_9EUPU|nr:unnamed protein product [Candidula unifasciata]
MALATRFRLTKTQDESFIDITKNLPSLQFESALSDDEKKLMILRPINHALTVTHCALVTVVVDVFKMARKILLSFLDQNKPETDSDSEDRDLPIVGIIGCGRLGRQIVNCLLTYGQLLPARLKISTRRPESLGLQEKGLECYFNNKRLVSSVHVIILCVLPSQIPCVAEEIKDCISSSQIVINLSSSLSSRKLCQIMHSSNILSPMLQWSCENPEVKYEHSLDVISALVNRETVLHTCPLGVRKTGMIVRTNPRLAETLILAVVNMCSKQGLSQEQSLTIIHTAVFGDSAKKNQVNYDRLLPQDFGITEISEDTNRCFPFYNLVDVFENGSHLSKVLLENESLQTAFISRYCHVFEDYIHKRKYGHL